ncbi:MAG: ABC transporter permease subunit [Candidatus Bathyarchaeia archaeon]|nr:ABC transporter permease subunit [Thermoproteota archaeon]MDT8781576.1 iron ABC transporter permease [Candidatus Bathyarchaeota archaeon]
MLSKILNILNYLSSKKTIKYALYFFAIIIFFALILVPPIIGILTKTGSLENIFENPELMDTALGAISASFIIGLVVSALDLIAGLPLAWLIARGKSKWLSVLDTLADIPFVVPTAALGYSLLLFWSSSGGVSDLFGHPFVSPGWLLVMLLHFTFSFPVVVRVIVGALMDYKMEYERASRTLGSPPLTAARTVTLPIIKPSLIAAFTLAFARSLSETGATFIVAAGVFLNGPVFIQTVSNQFNSGAISQASYEGATVFASLILIVVSLILFALIRVIGQKMKLPFGHGLASLEKKLSYKKAVLSRNGVALGVFLLIVLVPSLFVALPAFQALATGTTFIDVFTGSGVWASYWQSLFLSYGLAAVVTVLGILLGLPMAILIARKTFGKIVSGVLDTLINIPIIVPSIALGISLKFFWSNISGLPEFILLVFAHLAITYPYFVRSMSAAMERITIDMEEASKTLGAKPFTVFKSIVWPITKYSVLSGAIIVFTRSVSETGATLAVATELQTAPVLIVNWVNSVRTGLSTIVGVNELTVGLACGLLILFSFIILLILRLLTKKGNV